MGIRKILARQIYDSRGNPTVEVDITTDKGVFRAALPSGDFAGVHGVLEVMDKDPKALHSKGVFRAALPSGDFAGVHGVLEVMDKDPKALHSKGVSKAIANVNEVIGPALVKQDIDVSDQKAVDAFLLKLNGTESKSHLEANAILGVSLAVCKAGAAQKGVPLYRHIADLAGNTDVVLPVPELNMIIGGLYAGNKLAMREFMILPTGAATFKEAMRMGSETYHCLRNVIKKKYGQDACNVGDEGGFAPNIENIREGLDLLIQAISDAGYTGKMQIGIDAAASAFFKDGKYDLDFKNSHPDPKNKLTSDELTDLYKDLIADYPIVLIEDPFDQDDWGAFVKLTASVKEEVVGDDHLLTNPKRIQKGIDMKSCNAMLLKVNKALSVSEAIGTCKMSQENGWGVLVSHRSGETEDTLIADLAVGLCTGQIKAGAPCRSEHLAKYNQILRIEEELGTRARYAGVNFRNPVLK